MAIIPPELPWLGTVPLDARVLTFAVGLTLILGVVVGLVPAFRLARNPLHPLVNEAGRGSAGGGARHWLLSGLVVTEIALAVLLVTGAGLLIRSYLSLTATEPGFVPDRLLTATMNVPGHTAVTATIDSQERKQFQRRTTRWLISSANSKPESRRFPEWRLSNRQPRCRSGTSYQRPARDSRCQIACPTMMQRRHSPRRTGPSAGRSSTP